MRSRTLSGRRPRNRGRGEHHKRERQQRILNAARVLFARRGFPDTAMQQIAARAGLAVGTVYKYFPSKTDLLLAIVRRETDSALQHGRRLLADPPEDPAEALADLAASCMEGFMAGERRLWRELVAAAVAAPRTIGARLFESDALLVAQTAQLIEDLRRRGALAGGFDSWRAAITCYSIALSWMLMFLMSDGMSLDSARDEIRRGITLVVRGMVPRPAERTMT